MPVAVICNPVDGTLPAGTEAGLKNCRNDEDVCVVKFVLNSEQPPASPNNASAAMSHLRETIRTLSSRSMRDAGATKILRGLSGC